MKKTRFIAACNGFVEKAKGMVRRRMIDNALKSNELNVESELFNINEQKNRLVKTLVTCKSEDLKKYLQEMADLIQREKELKASKDLSPEILAILDEEIEVEEK